MKTLTNPQDTADCKRFISFFDAIPDNAWCVGALKAGNAQCALGHTGTSISYFGHSYRLSADSRRLVELLTGSKKHSHRYVTAINDGHDVHLATPKARILAALKALLPK